MHDLCVIVVSSNERGGCYQKKCVIGMAGWFRVPQRCLCPVALSCFAMEHQIEGVLFSFERGQSADHCFRPLATFVHRD